MSSEGQKIAQLECLKSLIRALYVICEIFPYLMTPNITIWCPYKAVIFLLGMSSVEVAGKAGRQGIWYM
jgi:hypothetical protein